jgi:DNA primase
MSREAVSLYDLESFDPRAARGGKERRFCCPFCGSEKPRDPDHRSLSVNTQTGCWQCFRCKTDGLLKEWWTVENKGNFNKNYKQAAIKAKFDVTPKQDRKPDVEESKKIDKIRARYEEFRSAFPGSPAAHYLWYQRGIDMNLATFLFGCGYAEKWEHWEKQDGKWILLGTDRRVIFPIRDRQGELVAICSRAIDEVHLGSKAITRGPKSLGAFRTPNALEAEIPIICEAPIDAMSLFHAGFPAIATIGTSGWPDWLIRHCAFRTVGAGFDADEPGDQASEKFSEEISKVGARTVRLRPAEGKDWNALLLKASAEGRWAEEINAQVKAALGLDEQVSPRYHPTERCNLCGGPVNFQEDEKRFYVDCPKGHYAGTIPKDQSDEDTTEVIF